ncbi:MAG: sugar transferase [Clostridia bacterium]|nr:sugar transferase [Clostridia bacterium]
MRKFRRSIMILCKFLLTAAMAGLFLFVFFNWYDEVYFFFKGNLVLLFLYLFIYSMFMYSYGGYKIGALRLRELVFSNAAAAFLTNFVTYFIMCLITYRMLEVWPLLVCFAAQAILSVLLYWLAFRLNEWFYPPVGALLIRSADAQDIAMADAFIRKSTRYLVRETLVGQSYEQIVAIAKDYNVLVTGMLDTKLRSRLMAYCFETGRQLFILPALEDIMLNSAAQYMAEDLLVYRCRNRAFTPDQLAVKRAMDIGFSVLLMLFTLPITLLTALAVKLYDGGPVFYKQERLTRHGQTFQLLKFRSMIPDAEKRTGAVRACDADPRVTPVGRFIRACRIDELPQLLNVLKGEMSLVGPRPERPEIFAEICRDFPQFAYRLKVKAGITGYAQLYGKYNTDFGDKVRLDLLYIEKASILQDLQLLFYTFKILFMKDSTAGVDAAQTAGVENETDEQPLS